MEDIELRTTDKTDPYGRMEAQLAHGLSPVQPDPEFVRRLRNRLTTPPDILLENRPKIPALLVVLGFVTTGILVLWVINKLRRMVIK